MFFSRKFCLHCAAVQACCCAAATGCSFNAHNLLVAHDIMQSLVAAHCVMRSRCVARSVRGSNTSLLPSMPSNCVLLAELGGCPSAPTSNQFVSRTPLADDAQCAAPTASRGRSKAGETRNAASRCSLGRRDAPSVAAARVCLRLAIAMFSIATFASAEFIVATFKRKFAKTCPNQPHARETRAPKHAFSQGFSYTVQRSSSANSSARWLKGHFQPEFSQG